MSLLASADQARRSFEDGIGVIRDETRETPMREATTIDPRDLA